MVNGSNFWSEKNKAVMKIRAKLLEAARWWLNQHDYVEVQGPTLIPAVGDWPGSFEVKYFDKRAYLSQGLQPYANAFVANLGKIYTIAPVFRAEKLRTTRHLTEYWRIEVAQQCDLETIIRIQEELLSHICHQLATQTQDEFEHLNRCVKEISEVQTPFDRLTYDEAIDLLQSDGLKISWGQEIDWELENHLSLRFNHLFFVTEFPIGIQTFFYKPHPRKPGLTLSMDLLAPEGYGEIGGGGQMIDKKEEIFKKMAEEEIELGGQQWYMDIMQYGSVPHSTFAIGVERLIQWLCRLKHIKESSAFPRLFDRIYP
jgi:asparaginyl-tRNA synthetase